MIAGDAPHEMDQIEQARSDAAPAARDPSVLPTRRHEWPFPPRPAARPVRPVLEPAALVVLAATARAWGLPGGAPAAPQAA
jgi:hypothetical protein